MDSEGIGESPSPAEANGIKQNRMKKATHVFGRKVLLPMLNQICGENEKGEANGMVMGDSLVESTKVTKGDCPETSDGSPMAEAQDKSPAGISDVEASMNTSNEVITTSKTAKEEEVLESNEPVSSISIN